MSKRIFTFWEPKSNMPGYLHLCMRTWVRFLPDYEVTVCDYSNLGDYLDKETLSEILCKKMRRPKQADCVRCALLKTHGGIWLDVDTVITSANCFEWMQRKSEVVMIGQPNTPSRVARGARANVGFIYASRPNTHFMNAWYSALPSRVRNYRIFCQFVFLRWIFRKKWREMTKWDYCANAIIDPILDNFSPDELMLIDQDDVGALPEYLSQLNDGNTRQSRLYRGFYLTKGDARTQVLEKTEGIVLLHHSWMPNHYRNMTVDDFLSQDILLVDLLKEVLK